MTPRLTPLPALLTLALALGCGHASPSPPARPLDLAPTLTRDASRPYQVAELRPGDALPRPDVTACADPRCGAAGTVAQVVLPHARAEVVALLDRYVSAMNARSPDGLRPLFDDLVGTTGGAGPRDGLGHARESVVAAHARLLDQMDRRGFGAVAVRVASFEECRAARCTALLRPGDWYVEWRPTSFRVAPVPGASAPTRMIVRVRDGSARIVALNDDFFARRAP